MNFLVDTFSFGPAPTLKRELAVTLVGMLVVIGIIVYGTAGGSTNLLVLAAILAVYLLGRVGYRIARPAEPRQQGTPERR